MNARFLPLLGLLPLLHAVAEPDWEVHDMNRPQPPEVTDATPNTEPPPADAVVLFDGTNLDAWVQEDGSEPRWRIVNRALEVSPDAGSLRTKEAFGSCRLHIEWRSPLNRDGEGQHAGNSGVFLMSLYEVQVLDSYRNPTYADGMAGSIYGQNPPSANPCRPPGEWNSYDITFHRPEYKGDGAVAKPARVTVVFNGVTVQDNYELTGRTAHKARATYSPHPDKLPLMLQDHGNPVQFRNIWLVPIED
jgi:Domain of Unknown Function (DUF1080).